MLEGYFDLDGVKTEHVVKRRKRLLAVQAALEIAKASVGSCQASNLSRVEDDLKNVASQINSLANAIQSAIGK